MGWARVYPLEKCLGFNDRKCVSPSTTEGAGQTRWLPGDSVLLVRADVSPRAEDLEGWGKGLWEDRGPGERLNKGI